MTTDIVLQNQLDAAALLAGLQRALILSPTLQVLESAAQAAYDSTQAAALGLKPFLNAQGHAMTETLSSGMSASAFLDARGNVIIVYQGTTTNAQYQLDVSLLSGTNASKLQGFSDALSFASQVEKSAASKGINQNQVYVTGHSLGGTLSAYVASQTGLGGAAFASSGVPGYQAPAVPAANFVSYVEKDDPFANYATDTAEKASAVVANPHMDHYGTVVQLGTNADAAQLSGFASAISGYSLGELEAGQVPVSAQTISALTQAAGTLMNEHHGLGGYDTDAASAVVSATAYGLQDTSMTQFMASVASDAKALLADIPKIFSAPNPTAAFSRFAGDFPDLAKEVTSMMHAQSFQAGLGRLQTVDPAIYTAITSPQGMAALVGALGQHSVASIPFHIA